MLPSTRINPSPAVRNDPVFQRVMGQLTHQRRVSAEYREEAKQALTPAVATGCAVVGGAGAGLLHAYLAPKTAGPATVVVGLLSVIGGAVSGTPEAVAVGNGMLAAMAAQYVHNQLAAPASATTKAAPAAEKPAEPKAA